MSDTISRQAAIDAVKAYWKKVVDDIPKGVGFEELTQLCNMALEHNANILKAIDQLPSAQPERKMGEWIPCSERLPEEGEIVLTQANIENMISLCVASRQDYNYWKGWNTREVNVVAWMPLPDPYDGNGEENKNEDSDK